MRAPPCKWNEEELEILKRYYPYCTNDEVLQMLPSKKLRQVVEKAHHMGIKKHYDVRRKITGKAMRKHKINEDFFKTWSHNQAYILGFIYADGHLDPNSYRLSLVIKDLDLLQSINRAMGSEYPILRDASTKRYYALYICSMTIYNDLVSIGLVQNKKDIKYPNVPDEFKPSFVRGFFDGDGSVSLRWNSRDIINTEFVSSSIDFLKGLHNDIKAYAGVHGGSLKKVKWANAYRLRYGHYDSIKLGCWMYSTNGIYLKRKWEVFQLARNSS
jgi:hypothetical protein